MGRVAVKGGIMDRYWLAEDQYGAKLKLRGKHPRKLLLDAVGGGKAIKIYVDTPRGAKHVGYVIRGNWWTIYEIIDWTKEAKNERH